MQNFARAVIAALALLPACVYAQAGPYVGDFPLSATVRCMWNSFNASGASVTRATNGTISWYEDGNLTQSTTGVTDSEDFDSLTGVHEVAIVASGANGFEAGKEYHVVLSGATIDSQTVNGQLCSFSVERSVNVRSWGGVALATTNPLPNAVAGASNGLLINGTNTGTSTFGAWTLADFNVTAQVNLADGLDVTRSTSNASALTLTGNGTGNGATITSGSGATGSGLSLVAASTNGYGLNLVGTGTGGGLLATPGATGHGFNLLGGATSGSGLRLAGTAGNSPAATFVGQGSAAGALFTGGATGEGMRLVGGATSGVGLAALGSAGNSGGASFTGQGTAPGATYTSGAGATGNGVQFTAASTNGSAIGVTPTGSGTVFSTNANANAAQVGGQTASAAGTVTFPGTLASTTNITAGTITTVTNLTNAPTAGDLTATMKTSVQTAATASLNAYDPPTRAEATADKDEILQSIGRRTTITVTDQDTFVLAAGATYDDAYIGWAVKINDAGSQDEWLGKIEDYVGSSKTVELNRTAGFTIATGDTVTLYPAFLYEAIDTALVNCEVNTTNFAGSTTTLACKLTDKDGAAVTVATGDLTGLELVITSGAQAYERRYLFLTTWDGTNSELQITLDRALPATVADAVTAIIR